MSLWGIQVILIKPLSFQEGHLLKSITYAEIINVINSFWTYDIQIIYLKKAWQKTCFISYCANFRLESKYKFTERHMTDSRHVHIFKGS